VICLIDLISLTCGFDHFLIIIQFSGAEVSFVRIQIILAILKSRCIVIVVREE
jgi:hypothetical protein